MPESNAMQRAWDDIEKPSACSFSLNGIDGRTTRWPATNSLLCTASGENWLVCPTRHRNDGERDPSSIKFDTRLTANNFPCATSLKTGGRVKSLSRLSLLACLCLRRIVRTFA